MTSGPTPTEGVTPSSGVTPDGEQHPTPDGGGDSDLDAVKKALDAERKNARQLAKDNAELNKRLEAIEDSQRSESERRDRDLERTRGESTELQGKLTKAEYDHLRRDAADAAGLPKGWWKRLSGETPEDLAADAKEIADDLIGTPDLGAGARPGGPATGTSEMNRRIRDSRKR